MVKKIFKLISMFIFVLGLSYLHVIMIDETIYAFNQKNLARIHRVITEDEFFYLPYWPEGVILLKPQVERL